jgi:hypothetical protein
MKSFNVFTFFLEPLSTTLHIYFIAEPCSVISCITTPIVFNENANTPHPKSSAKMTNQVSVVVTGTISPYPTVSIVVVAQYRDLEYLTETSSLMIP